MIWERVCWGVETLNVTHARGAMASQTSKKSAAQVDSKALGAMRDG